MKAFQELPLQAVGRLRRIRAFPYVNRASRQVVRFLDPYPNCEPLRMKYRNWPILALMLLAAYSHARADWIKVGQTEQSVLLVLKEKTTYYVDPTSIVREGNLRRVWEIHDLSDKGASGERSVLASVEYDCVGKRMRTLAATGRSLSMARGEIIHLGSAIDDWIELRAGKEDAIFFKIMDMVCTP